jgi:arylsulfatase A-like enzyme
MKTSRIFLVIAAVLAVSAVAIFLLRPSRKEIRSVVLISIDTLRADHLGCYGYSRPTSPNIDAFARRGARFEYAISSSGWTVPAHMTMFTGLDPLAHGIGGYPHPGRQRPKTDTLAQILRRNDFVSGAFNGGGYLLPRFGFHLGFDQYKTKGRHFLHNIKNARAWLRNIKDRRFFMFLHGYDVHKPYTPTPENGRLFAGDYGGTFSLSDLSPEKPRPSDADLHYAVSQYDAEIRDVDDELGKLFAEWEESGLLDETLVILTSDHGDEFYEHGQVYHAHSLYDELLRVPLIIVGPGVAPAVHATQVGLIDLAPTILSALGLGRQAAGMQGIDLMPVLRGQGELPKRLLLSSLVFSDFPYSIAALRSDDWKLIAWNAGGMRGHTFTERREDIKYKLRLDRLENFDELFDLRNDPGETKDVGSEHAATRERLRSILETRLTAGAVADKGTEKPRLSPKEIEDLKALGYL